MEEKDEKEKICTEILSPGFGGLPPPLPVALTGRPRDANRAPPAAPRRPSARLSVTPPVFSTD